MRTTWRFFSSLFSPPSAGGGAPAARPPVHPLQPKEQRVPGSLSLPTLHLSLTAAGFSLLRAFQWSLTFVIAASATVALWFWCDSRLIAKLAAHLEQFGGARVQRDRHHPQRNSTDAEGPDHPGQQVGEPPGVPERRPVAAPIPGTGRPRRVEHSGEG